MKKILEVLFLWFVLFVAYATLVVSIKADWGAVLLLCLFTSLLSFAYICYVEEE